MLTMGLLTMTSVDADRVLPHLRVHHFLFLPRSRHHHTHHRVTRLAVQAHMDDIDTCINTVRQLWTTIAPQSPPEDETQH